MHANVVLGNSEKSLVNSGDNKKSERIKKSSQIFHNMMYMGTIMNCSLQVQIKFELSK